jgi:hypothetical protein
MQNLGKPIIADYVSGLVGLATVAFGVASGIAHGVGGRERFNAGQWEKLRKKSGKTRQGGPTVRVANPDLDKSMTIEELSLLANAWGGTLLVDCGDKNCCSHGIQDMTENWHAHFLYQIFGRVAALERLPNLSRTRHFLETDMANADRLARQVKELKTGDEVLTKRLIKHIQK